MHLNQPDWSDHSHSLAVTIQSLGARFLLHCMFNAYSEPLKFEVPPVAAETGEVATLHGYGADLPDDLLPRDAAPAVSQGTYVVQPRSIVVLALALPGATGSALGTG